MTCVCGVTDGAHLVIGGDSARSNSDGERDLVRPKVFERDGMLFGSSGELRTRQLLQHAFELPALAPGRDPEAYMAVDFCPALYRFMKDQAEYLLPKSYEDGGGWTLLVGVAGRLFTVSSWFDASESITGYDAIGIGNSIALGSLASTEGRPARERVELALRAAERHHGKVAAPFTILEQRVDLQRERRSDDALRT